MLGPVLGEDLCTQVNDIVFEARQNANWRMATAAECCEERALRRDAPVGFRIIDRGQKAARLCIVSAAFEADRALRHCRQHRLDIERYADVRMPEPVQSGRRQHRGMGLAIFNPRNPGCDITAKRHDFQVGPESSKLCSAPWGRSADDGSLGQGCNADCADQPVADIGPFEHCDERDSLWPDRLDIFHRMNAGVGTPLHQGAIECLGPQCLAANFGERTILNDVAVGRDRDDFDLVGGPAVRCDQRSAGHMGLSQGKRRSARTQPDFGRTGSHVAARASAARVTCNPPTVLSPIILGIESSCDETAAAVISGDRQILSHRLAGQESEHAPFGGVVPEIAARAHVEVIMPLVKAALADARLTLADVDAIAATAGPGLIGGVMVGLVTAKALAHAANKPLIAVNHLEGHALSPRLSDANLCFPYLLLLVSGGHCQLLSVEGVGRYRRLATTIDDAAGEAFDKTAKLLGLGFPGGPAVERAAARGNAKAVPLPRPLLGSPEPHFSFAGLKSAVLRARDAGTHRSEDIAASFQAAVVDCLTDRTRRALDRLGQGVSKPTALVVAGGVAANAVIRLALAKLADDRSMPFVAPPLWLCTDNAAMIGWAGAERFALGLTDALDVAARPRWALDPDAEIVRGAGIKA